MNKFIKDPPDNVWVRYMLPIIEGRCIPESRFSLIEGKWVREWRYPAPIIRKKVKLKKFAKGLRVKIKR